MKKLAQVFHFDLYGKREDKYDFLNENSLATIAFTELNPQEPELFFVPKDFEEQKVYDEGFSVNELFYTNSVGIVTARDEFTIHNSKIKVKETIEKFLSLDDETARTKFNLGKDVRDWQVNFARKDLLNNYPNESKFVKISYRPFDEKYTFYTGKAKGFHCYPRNEVMQHFINGENIGLITARSNKSETCDHFYISKNIMETKCGERTTQSAIFPLYLYPETNAQQTLHGNIERTPNFNLEIVKQLAEGLGLNFTNEPFDCAQGATPATFAPIDVLDYIYAVLHSPTYREKYAAFLKIDFPRVPYPKNKEIFWQLVKLGGEIRQIHLLESALVEKYITQYPIDGDNIVVKPRFENGKVYLNENQYFANVPEVAWNFYIGGYQPAQKWLKDRKGKELNTEDIFHYQKIIVALSETDSIMKKIDKIDF
ncbi:MAG: type ISP restriction/modification enzyme [Lutibacter sp.]|nr:type ISP restriction/modification enzyme [Lutibacter sp.]